MAEYIDREALIADLGKSVVISCKNTNVPLVQRILRKIMNCIKEQPTADVAEVRHGEWKLKSETNQLFDDVDEEFYVECPLCHRIYYVPFELDDRKMLEYAKQRFPYCNCGAKMDK